VPAALAADHWNVWFLAPTLLAGDLRRLAAEARDAGPNGQYVITPEMEPAFVPVGKFHGIGPATSAKMNGLGLYTGHDMRNQSFEFMQANFGKAGSCYYWISRGIDNREVRANRVRKSVGPKTPSPAISQRLKPCLRNCSR
jgi:DNA polymerase-4